MTTIIPKQTEILIFENQVFYPHRQSGETGNAFTVMIGGNSMAPTYKNADVLACRKINKLLFYEWGKVYVFDTSQGTLVKRVFQHTDPKYIVCVSDNNDNFPPFDLPISDISRIGIVLGLLRIGDS